MTNRSQAHNFFTLICFILIVSANSIYVYYLKHTFETVNSAWFLMAPLIGYVYFAFAIIACVYIYRRDKLGYALTYPVILIGMIADVLSYTEVNLHSTSHDILLAALILANIIVLLLIGLRSSNRSNR